MNPAAAVPAPDGPKRKDASPKRRWLRRIAFVCYLFVLLEVGARVYFFVDRGMSLTQTDFTLAFYPEAQQLVCRPSKVVDTDETVDVLLLGGSVLHRGAGDIAERLHAALASALGRSVAIHNLAWPAHTSRDSLVKYGRLGEHRFDLVLVYHGINETRMNACPEDMFRDDYTHGSWYARIEAIASHPELPWMTWPYALHVACIKVGEWCGRYQPRRHLTGNWIEHTDYVRSDRAMEQNLRGICRVARERAERLLLLTFATHLPEGYDLDRHSSDQREGVNDYCEGGTLTSTIEMWGKPSVVVDALRRHNEVVRRVGRTEPGVELFEMAPVLSHEGRLFMDVCHLSPEGCQRWVDAVTPHIVALLAGQR